MSASGTIDGVRRAPALVLVTLLSSSCLSVCGGIEPHSPTSSLEEDPKIPLNTCRGFAMHYSLGGTGGIQYLTELSARCADPTICVAKIEAEPIGHEAKAPAHVYLAGLRTGKTKVLVEFVDPSSQKRTTKAIDVELTGPIPERLIEVGKESPRDELVVVRDRSGEPFQCQEHGEAGFRLLRAQLDMKSPKSDAGSSPMARLAALPAEPSALAPSVPAAPREDDEGAAVLGCSARREIAPGRRHFCTGAGASEEDLWVCVSRAEEKYFAPVRGLVLYRRGPDGLLRADEVRGEPDRSHCPRE